MWDIYAKASQGRVKLSEDQMIKLILLILFGLIIYKDCNAQQKSVKSDRKKSNDKTLSDQTTTTYLDINNIKALQGNNGFSDFNLNSNLEGLEWPKESNKTDVYMSGFLWGGYVQGDPQVRVGGSAYLSGLRLVLFYQMVKQPTLLIQGGEFIA